jgi:hypothetical protein
MVILFGMWHEFIFCHLSNTEKSLRHRNRLAKRRVEIPHNDPGRIPRQPLPLVNGIVGVHAPIEGAGRNGYFYPALRGLKRRRTTDSSSSSSSASSSSDTSSGDTSSNSESSSDSDSGSTSSSSSEYSPPRPPRPPPLSESPKLSQPAYVILSMWECVYQLCLLLQFCTSPTRAWEASNASAQ